MDSYAKLYRLAKDLSDLHIFEADLISHAVTTHLYQQDIKRRVEFAGISAARVEILKHHASDSLREQFSRAGVTEALISAFRDPILKIAGPLAITLSTPVDPRDLSGPQLLRPLATLQPYEKKSAFLRTRILSRALPEIVANYSLILPGKAGEDAYGDILSRYKNEFVPGFRDVAARLPAVFGFSDEMAKTLRQQADGMINTGREHLGRIPRAAWKQPALLV